MLLPRLRVFYPCKLKRNKVEYFNFRNTRQHNFMYSRKTQFEMYIRMTCVSFSKTPLQSLCEVFRHIYFNENKIKTVLYVLLFVVARNKVMFLSY